MLEQKHLKICLFKNEAFYELIFCNYFTHIVYIVYYYYVIKSLIQVFHIDTYYKKYILSNYKYYWLNYCIYNYMLYIFKCNYLYYQYSAFVRVYFLITQKKILPQIVIHLRKLSDAARTKKEAQHATILMENNLQQYMLIRKLSDLAHRWLIQREISKEIAISIR